MIKKLVITSSLIVAGISLLAQNDSRNWSVNLQPSKAFIENKGQFSKVNNAKVEYAIDNEGSKIYFSANGLTYSFFKSTIPKKEKYERENKSEAEREKEEHAGIVKTDVVNLTWENSNPNAKIVAEEKTADYFSYTFKKGKEMVNVNNINAFKKITYKNLYPNIDVEYTFHPTDGIKYTVILHPGADASQLKMKYTDANKLSVKPDNDLHIRTDFGDIIDHAPVTFYANNTSSTITSKFIKSGNSISFLLGAYDKSQTVIIDPWTQTPGISNSHGVWECEKDASGNVYIIGGDSPMKLLKYNSAGTLQWTYVTPWDTANDWLGTFVTDLVGNSYVTDGSTAAIQKINTSGSLVYNATGGSLDEYWNIALNCDQTKLIIAGTKLNGVPPTGNGVIFDLNTSNGSVTSVKNVGKSRAGFGGFNDPEEVRAITSSQNARYYFMTLDSIGSIDQNFNSCSSSNSGILFEINHTYKFGYKCEDWRPKGNSGIMAIRANKNFVYTQNGKTIDKRSLTTGAILTSVTIPGGVSTASFGFNQPGNCGIDIDSCGNVYVGSTNAVIKYDANLNLISNTAVSFHVYDVSVSYGGNVIVCGATGTSSSTSRTGTVQSLNLSSCDPHVLVCCDANVCAAGPFCTSDPSYTLSPVTAGGTWSGTGVNSSGVFSPATAGAGTHAIVYTLPCGSDSLFITVSACASLNVCINAGTLSVSGGTPSYTWQTQNTVTSCTACISGCNFPPGCSVTVTSWSTAATGTSTFTPGSYPVRVTDNAGNSYTITTANSVPTCTVSCTPPTVSITSFTNVSCFGGNNGGATANATPSGTYTYTWMPGTLTGATQTGFTAGVYSVTASSTGGCTGTATVNITQPPALNANATVTQSVTCSGGTNGSATVTATGGTPGYTYSWSNGGTGSSISGVPGGVYTVTVTDASSCVTTSTVNINRAPDVIASASTNCLNGVGSATVTVTGGTPGFTYSWSSGQTTSTVSGLAQGVYTVTITNANNCIHTLTVNICNTTGINQVAANNMLTLYPNPANGTITLGLQSGLAKKNYEVRILDLLGKEIKNLNNDAVNGSMQIDISDLSVGVYFVTVKTEEGLLIKRFIVQR